MPLSPVFYAPDWPPTGGLGGSGLQPWDTALGWPAQGPPLGMPPGPFPNIVSATQKLNPYPDAAHPRFGDESPDKLDPSKSFNPKPMVDTAINQGRGEGMGSVVTQ